MRRYLSTLLLGIVMLSAPLGIQAKDHPRRYYDRYHKDYHVWNDQENRAYRHWVQDERKREYHPWARARRNEQTEYWRWRHEHSDWR